MQFNTSKAECAPCSVVGESGGRLVVCDGLEAQAAVHPDCDTRWVELAHDSEQLARSIKALPLIIGALHDIASIEGEEGSTIAVRVLLALDLC